jgi:hypothetical protein
VSLLNTIARSLEAASGKTSTASKVKGKKAKEVAAAVLLPVASAVDMLMVCDASAFTDGEAAEVRCWAGLLSLHYCCGRSASL